MSNFGSCELLGLAQPRPHATPLSRRQQADSHVTVAARRRSDRCAGCAVCRATARWTASGRRRPAPRSRTADRATAPPPRNGRSRCNRRCRNATGGSRRPAPPTRPAPQRSPRRCPSGGKHRAPGRRSRSGQRRRQGVEHRVGSAPGRPWAVDAEVGDRHRDEMRVPLRQLRARAAEHRGSTGIAAVHHDVGGGGQLDRTARGPRRRPDRARQLRLLALFNANETLAPATVGCAARAALPPGGSTFSTSAPRSANSRVTASASPSHRSSTRSSASSTPVRVVRGEM